MMMIDACIHEEEHNRVRVVINERESECVVGEKVGLERRLTMMMMMMIMMIDMCIYL